MRRGVNNLSLYRVYEKNLQNKKRISPYGINVGNIWLFVITLKKIFKNLWYRYSQILTITQWWKKQNIIFAFYCLTFGTNAGLMTFTCWLPFHPATFGLPEILIDWEWGAPGLSLRIQYPPTFLPFSKLFLDHHSPKNPQTNLSTPTTRPST